MKKLIFLVSIIILIVSCTSTPSGKRPSARNVKFRAKEIWFSNTTYKYYTDYTVQIISLDSAYKAGDTIEIKTGQFDNETFILLERVK